MQLLKDTFGISRKAKEKDFDIEKIDEYFVTNNLVRVSVEKDLNYMFKIFAEAIFFDQTRYEDLRGKLHDFIKMHEEFEQIFEDQVSMDTEEYLEKLLLQSVDPMIELAILLFICKRNLRIIYG